MTIGQVAERAGVGIETVRFYERRGLIQRPPRPATGYRNYPTDAVARIVFVRRAKELGFSLKEIVELLSLRVKAGANCETVKRRAEKKVADIETKLADLRRMRRTIHKLVTACENRRSTADCPILGMLDGK